jgi:hypothetical protein
MQPPPAGLTHVLIQREALGTLTQMKRTEPALWAKAPFANLLGRLLP